MVQFKATRQLKHASGIAEMLEDRIRAGAYPVDAQLPTVRDLAEQLKVNKNTVVRAYQILKRHGYLELKRGSGAYVKRRDTSAGDGNGIWQVELERLIEDAKRRALDRDQVLKQIERSVDRVYAHGAMNLAFVECNDEDIQSMTAQLAAATGYSIQGILLSNYARRASEFADQNNLIITTFFHLAEVRNSLPAPARSRVIGVNAIPNHDALLNIARLETPVIGLVCALPTVVETLTNLIRTYHPSATIISALIEDRARVETLFEKADAIVVTRGYEQPLLNLKPKLPVIAVQFSIEQQSIDFLENKIREQGEKVNK